MTATVIPATLDDVEFIAHVLYCIHVQADGEIQGETEACWGVGAKNATTEQVLGLVEGSVTYVVKADAEPVGRLRVVRTDRHLEIAGIQILPDHQRKGIGTAVLTMLLQEARERGVPAVLQVSKTNPDAERLYTRLGFRRTGQEDEHDYWMIADGRWE